MDQAARDRLRRGVELFNAGEFFECHEVLEEIWTPARDPERGFLQALIHFAVGFYHHQRDNRAGAERQLRKGLHKIDGYRPEYLGIETEGLSREVTRLLEAIGRGERVENFPRIEVL